MRKPPTSLRNIPLDVLKLAQDLSTQTGLSINDVFRLALASGVLIELTKVSPRLDGTFCGLPAASLAKALRPHLGSAIDLMREHGQHPYLAFIGDGKKMQSFTGSEQPAATQATSEKSQLLAGSIEENLDMLGIGIGLSDTLRADT